MSPVSAPKRPPEVPAIEVERLIKTYRRTPAVNGVSFTVARGEVFGLLGPNGAGKTTIVEIIEGLRPADSGAIRVLGMDLRKETTRVKQRIGVATQSSTLLPNLTCRELLTLWGSFYPDPTPPGRLLERLGIAEKGNAIVQTLSGGQQQRLSIALALVGNPEIVFLDEPTTGLDPHARRGLWEVIADLRRNETTILLTTHYMEEAERLCDRIAILDRGHLLALDSPRGLIRTHFPDRSPPTPGPTLEDVFLKLTGRALWQEEE
ncbi:MAG: ABC transporter ATP-binding protein [Capsulimonadales bacterium]|nr:ABC transporter ATP-binding protein [Capsulimonadales bacterium]